MYCEIEADLILILFVNLFSIFKWVFYSIWSFFCLYLCLLNWCFTLAAAFLLYSRCLFMAFKKSEEQFARSCSFAWRRLAVAHRRLRRWPALSCCWSPATTAGAADDCTLLWFFFFFLSFCCLQTIAGPGPFAYFSPFAMLADPTFVHCPASSSALM